MMRLGGGAKPFVMWGGGRGMDRGEEGGYVRWQEDGGCQRYEKRNPPLLPASPALVATHQRGRRRRGRRPRRRRQILGLGGGQ